MMLLGPCTLKMLTTLLHILMTLRMLFVYPCRVTGGELFHYLAEKDHVSEEVAAKFTKQILEGLKHMHDRNICHLDLKVIRS